MPADPVSIGQYRCGTGCPLLFIVGPCVIESEEFILDVAGRLAEVAAELDIPLVFRPTARAFTASAAPVWNEALRF